MTNLPFSTYDEATTFFDIPIPKLFFNQLTTVDTFCQSHKYDTLDVLTDLFGILRVEGKEARYQQTPIEMFPFGSTGSDGIHYGFIIHTLDTDDFPSSEICPMDSDGVIMIGNDSKYLFQNLISDPVAVDKYLPLLKELNLAPEVNRNKRYDQNGNGVRIKLQSRQGWQFIDTSDGAGVFAEEKYFDSFHELFTNDISRSKTIVKFEELANEMQHKGLYASQLFYLKELYWNEWTNYELAKKYLRQMLLAYEKLDRQHLYTAAKEVLDTFDERYPPYM
jgi:hypothetical protein